MSEFIYSSVRALLTSSSDVTNLVPASSITPGFSQIHDSYPCITITVVGGADIGYMGYGTSPAGSKIRRNNTSVQIDIYTRHSLLSSQSIGDAITKTLMNGTGFRKAGEVDVYEDELKAHRKIQTWNILTLRND